MQKKILTIMLTLVILVFFSACSNSGDTSGKDISTPDSGDSTSSNSDTSTDGKKEPVTIRFATQTIQEGAVMEQILNEYKDDYPNVTLELEEAPGNDLITKIHTDIMADNCPDVFTYWRPEKKWNFDLYISKGAIADLTELKESDFYKDMFPDYAWKTASVDGIVRGIPRLNFYTCFIVNKTIFDELNLELPTDWDKLVTACETLSAKGYIPWATDTGEGLDDASRLFNAVIEATLGNERGLKLMQGLESWKQPDVIEALGYFMQVAKPGYLPEDSSVLDSTTVITKYLNTGKAAMLINNASQVWANLTPDVMDQMVALNFPLTPTTKVDKPCNELDLTNLVYASAKGFNDPAKKEYIVELIHRLTSREAAKRYAEEERAIIPHLGVDIDPSKVHPLQIQAAELAYAAIPCKWMLSYTSSDVVDDFRLTINGVWYGEFDTPEQLAAKLDENLYGKQQ